MACRCGFLPTEHDPVACHPLREEYLETVRLRRERELAMPAPTVCPKCGKSLEKNVRCGYGPSGEFRSKCCHADLPYNLGLGKYLF